MANPQTIESIETISDSCKILEHKDNNNKQINVFLDTIKTIINQGFTSMSGQGSSPCPTIRQALNYTMLSNGKRLRPALVYAVAQDLTGNDNELLSNKLLLNSALAIELIHTYSIVHDDLPAMDDDDLRRGQPSCHIKYNEATAILIGDCLQSLAFELLADTHNLANKTQSDLAKQIKIINILSQAIGHQGMVAGQSIELNKTSSKQNLDQSLDNLNNIHNLKTGKLFSASLQIGAIIANADTNNYKLLTKLGANLGLAFQIQDDILDNTQNTEKLGKPNNSDTARNLLTYSNIIGKEQAQDILNNLWQQCGNIIQQLDISSPNNTISLLVNKIKCRSN